MIEDTINDMLKAIPETFVKEATGTGLKPLGIIEAYIQHLQVKVGETPIHGYSDKAGRVNGIQAKDVITEHALMREGFGALVYGDSVKFCKKHGLEFDGVYMTASEAIYEHMKNECYLFITDKTEV